MKTLFSGLLITALLTCSIITECAAQKKFEEENQRDLATISKVYAKYAMDETPGITADTNLIGIWKMKEDEDSHNYFVFERNSPNSYALTYMNHEGANRTWENFTVFFSRIGKTEFLNIPFYN
ncbi:MAG: hypothetical protein JSS82_01630 [Bacteroidetes bacterium]|nr:hypothetical protein [Bacteroidota bacterium]